MGKIFPLFPVLQAVPTESFAEARRAIQPMVEQSPALAEKVALHLPMPNDYRCKTASHEPCGGTFHMAGKVPDKFPVYLRVCDKCGDFYHSR